MQSVVKPFKSESENLALSASAPDCLWLATLFAFEKGYEYVCKQPIKAENPGLIKFGKNNSRVNETKTW